MINNLTVGNPFKLIVKFAIPLLLGNLFMQLYQISDMIIVGHLISINALAAIGASTPIYMVFLMIAFGFTGGLTVITAQRFGARDYDGVRQSAFHCVVASAVLSLVLTLFLLIFLRPILQIMNVPADIFNDAYKFMFVLNFSTVFIIFYNLMSGLIRALGDSRTPLYFLIFSSLMNIILNFVFINNLHMGIIGSAAGTLVANLMSIFICFIYMWRKFPLLRPHKDFMHFEWKIMYAHLRIALPMALQFSILSFSIMIVQSVCNSFGTDVIAGFAAALRVEQFATQPLLAIGLAMATFSAQNWGANLLSRIRKGVKYAALLSATISVLGFFAIRKVADAMMVLFVDTGDITGGNNIEMIIEIGKQYLIISTMFYISIGMIFVFRNTIQGMGKPLIPLLSCVVELVTRAFAAIYLAKIWGYKGIMYASPISWTSAALLVIIGYIYYIRKFSKEKIRWQIGRVKQSLNENSPVD